MFGFHLTASHTLVVSHIKLFFLIINKVKDFMKWMNENTKWHELIEMTTLKSVFQCQPTALLCASDSTQGGYMELSAVYFRIMHLLGRPHYVWDEYLYSVLEKVEIRVTVSLTVCVVRDDDERKGEGETWCRLIACSYRKAPRGPPHLTSPSDGRIAINNIIWLLNIYAAEGFGI